MENILSYTAGLMDGEGTISLIKGPSGKFRVPYVAIASTSRELIDFLVKNFGGTVSNKKIYKEHHKKSYAWVLRYDKALDFIEKVRPYMIEKEKIRRADLLINEYKKFTIRNGKYNKEQKELKLLFEERFFTT